MYFRDVNICMQPRQGQEQEADRWLTSMKYV